MVFAWGSLGPLCFRWSNRKFSFPYLDTGNLEASVNQLLERKKREAALLLLYTTSTIRPEWITWTQVSETNTINLCTLVGKQPFHSSPLNMPQVGVCWSCFYLSNVQHSASGCLNDRLANCGIEGSKQTPALKLVSSVSCTEGKAASHEVLAVNAFLT